MDKLKAGFHQSFIEGDRWLMYVKGIGVTLEVAAVALLLGIVLGVLVAVVRTLHDQQRQGVHNPVLGLVNQIAKIYTTVIRGTPLMVQLLIMYFVIFSNTRNAVGVAMLTFGINSGAYVAEIIRGGIMSVDKGQMEAARSLGLSYTPAMRFVVIPQAIKNILPALGNELIALLKDTSLVTVIGVRDLTKAAQLIQGKTYQALFPFVGIAIVYLLLVMLIAALIGIVERRLAASDRR
ncbi:MAG: amino acid ABC transporter permease [Lachnospiraceae bacterium]|nr:amino acid ABC transporter permease [Lachnospiraceae bacterium]